MRLVDVLEERLEDTDGHVAGDEHAAADHGDDDLRETADEADGRTGRVGQEIRTAARVGELLLARS